jgi:hypothetical protein
MSYFYQLLDAHQTRGNQPQPQQQQQTLQSLNNNGQFINPQINIPQQPAAAPPMLSHPQHQLNHMVNSQSRFPSVQQSHMTNPQPNIISNQSAVLNQGVRLREPQKFNQRKI